MNISELEAKITFESDVNTSENVKHFEKMKELLAELINEFNSIQYGANIKSCDIIPKDHGGEKI